MGIKISPMKKLKVFNKTKGECSYCGAILSEDNFVIDHVYPRARGGDNNIDNLLPSCYSCNLSKGAKSLKQFRRMCAFKETFHTSLFNQSQVDYLFENDLAVKMGVDMNFMFHFENMGVNHETI